MLPKASDADSFYKQEHKERAMQRRTMLKHLAVGLTGSTTLVEQAMAVPDELGQHAPLEFPADQPVPTVDEILASMPRFQGTKPAYVAEIAKGKEIANGCVSGCTPIEVAQYFEQLRTGAFDATYGSDASLYAQEWPVRANPVIVGFFDATSLRTPAGDQTAWCAAFMNWCIARARPGNHATGSAASASFRTWATKTDDPLPGDIAVFKSRSTPSHGHVAFVVSKAAQGVYVLGGNQMPMRVRKSDGTYAVANTGEVNTKFFPIVGKDLELHSFRTADILHN
jgi:uncharacterized protein (TIGR02594 family)